MFHAQHSVFVAEVNRRGGGYIYLSRTSRRHTGSLLGGGGGSRHSLRKQLLFEQKFRFSGAELHLEDIYCSSSELSGSEGPGLTNVPNELKGL